MKISIYYYCYYYSRFALLDTNKRYMYVCVSVSDTSVVEGESQIQMGRFISFLQVGDLLFLSWYCLLLDPEKHWEFLSFSMNRNCPVLCQDVMKWWSTLSISWLLSTTATSKIQQPSQAMLHSESTVWLMSKEPFMLHMQAKQVIDCVSGLTIYSGFALLYVHNHFSSLISGVQRKLLSHQVSISRWVLRQTDR